MANNDPPRSERSMNEPPALHNSSISPVFPVSDIEATVAHYQQLGFEVEAYPRGGYAFARSGRSEIHLQQVSELDPSTSTSACYLYVQDANALFRQWQDSEIGGRLVAPFDTEYGLREFAHVDIDGNLLRVGSPLS